MDRPDWDQQQQLEEERLCRTLDALYEVHNCGLKETAEFLATELRVKQWFKPEVVNATHR